MNNDRLSLAAPIALDRRDFLAGAVAVTGFALAAGPAQATAITTDSAGLEDGLVQIPAEGGPVPAYYARPASAGPHPLVLVVQEIFGVHEHIRDICRRLAKLGALAVAPELYVRQGDPSKYTEIPTLLRELVSKVPDAQVLADLDACMRWAEGNGMAQPGRTGITGFCWGGRITWLYAAHAPTVKAAVAWYGRLAGDVSANTPRHPLDVAAGLHCPVLGLYGGADQGIPLETVERMKAALTAAGKAAEIVVYPDAPHAFHADYRPSYREQPASDGWARLVAWFQTHGVLDR